MSKDDWKVSLWVQYIRSWSLTYDNLGSRSDRIQTFMGTPRIWVDPRVVLVRPDSQDLGTDVL